jgi:hypothetical protein
MDREPVMRGLTLKVANPGLVWGKISLANINCHLYRNSSILRLWSGDSSHRFRFNETGVSQIPTTNPWLCQLL